MKRIISCLMLLTAIFSLSFAQSETPEVRLEKPGIQLPPSPPPAANYVNAVTTGNLVFLPGKGPNKEDGTYVAGKVGRDLTVEIYP